tara:strand:- start:250 stop:1074 length:825 start_codon:yes stop_codon:yes gene_type:complete
MYRLAFWILFDIILEIIPEKARKIIGSFLLIFGTIAILWATSAELDAWTGIVGIVAIFVGIYSIGLGLYVWWGILSGSWEKFEDEEYISPESTLENSKQQIECSSCNQKLNIPFSYTGMISCPACGIYIKLNEGIIQLEDMTLVEENDSKVLELNEGIIQAENKISVEEKDLKVLKLDEMTDLIWIIFGLLFVIIIIFSFFEYGFSSTFGWFGFTIIGVITFFLLLPVICIISGILIMILSKLNLVRTDGNWGTPDLIQSVFGELYPEYFNEEN